MEFKVLSSLKVSNFDHESQDLDGYRSLILRKVDTKLIYDGYGSQWTPHIRFEGSRQRSIKDSV